MTHGSAVPVALLGAGGIATMVADAYASGGLPGIRIVAVAGSTAGSASAARLAERIGARPVAAEDLLDVGCRWVVEAASGAAVKRFLPALWEAKVDTVVMSIGALADDEVFAAYQRARAAGVRVVLPSGGIAGLDAVRTLAAAGGLTRVRITTTKAPAGLRGAPYLTSHGIELPDDRAVTVFEGTARTAIAGFPANVNVAIALSLAGLGVDATEVVIHSDPSVTRTRQRIEAEGPNARIEVHVETSTIPSNPRTSFLAGASAVAAVRDIAVT